MSISGENKVKIKEIFASVQGEGPYVGCEQIFVRFCDCNLNCNYCDTDFKGEKEYTANSLKEHIEKYDLSTVHSLSLTGGEPLIFSDFLNEFLPLVNVKKYLETNATLWKDLEKIEKHIDIISADIKLPSSTKIKPLWTLHDKFFETVKKYNKEIFAKVVFNDEITEDEIKNCIQLAKKHELELILQPQTKNNEILPKSTSKIFERFLSEYNHTRLIPQVHKYLGVE